MPPAPTITQIPNLGDKQFKVLLYTAEGKSAQEIARIMDIAVNTVYVHRRIVYDRCGVNPRSRKALRAYAVEHKIVPA